MGQKVNPVGFRIGVVNTWVSQWFARKGEYAKNLLEDHKIREIVGKKLKDAGVDNMQIRRYSDRIVLTIYTSRPGVVIGRQGANLSDLEDLLRKKVQKRFEVKVEEIHKPDLHAKLVGEAIAQQITNRISYRRAAKMAMQRVMESGAKGVKVLVKGRLGGSDIARGEFFIEGQIPLSTMRADISYASVMAWTSYGQVGVKVWIYRGDVFSDKNSDSRSTVDVSKKNK